MQWYKIVRVTVVVSTVQTVSKEELLSTKTAPMADSTMSARTFGTSIRPFECKGYSEISSVNFRICTRVTQK